ncbi:Lrp/AsnC family transcriptional regulator [Candidatus Woesearchaeota archaeon]|jgi:DNA-binding Lrp family transcriptional regulator|nr:Lrp/AsnC family transcriptional regulator [Candidatus Woesearchaeota archaeon]
MKDIKSKLIQLFKTGHATPQIAQIARKIKEPATTIHYNIKKLEKIGAIKTYKAVFNHKKINCGFTAFVLLNLSPDEYGDPERIGKDLAKHDEIESVDVITGDWELIVKLRVKDQDEYYNLIKNVISRKGVVKIKTLTSLKEVKTEFVEM